MTKTIHHTRQLGFETLLLDADQTNHTLEFEKRTGHLPDTMAEALPFFVGLLEAHHEAMLSGMVDEAMFCRKEARELALKLNNGQAGILAHPDSPGTMLARETAAPRGIVPLWGQTGSFVVEAAGARVRVETDGLFGIGCVSGFWPGFAAHAVDLDRPFISETGYRSFLGIHAAPCPGLTPEAFAGKVIAAHVAKEMKGRLVPIETRIRKRAA